MMAAPVTAPGLIPVKRRRRPLLLGRTEGGGRVRSEHPQVAPWGDRSLANDRPWRRIRKECPCSLPSTTIPSTRSRSPCASSVPPTGTSTTATTSTSTDPGPSSGTDDEMFAVIGLGQYPNLGVADAFISVLKGNDHRVVRCVEGHSAPIGWTPAIGPIRVEVLDGLRRVRVIVEPNEWGVEMDAVYDGFSEAHLEARHFDRQFSRVTFDSTRFAQTGSWTGTMKLGDDRDRPHSRPMVGITRPLLGSPAGRRSGAPRHQGHRHRQWVLLDLRTGPFRRPRHRHHHPRGAQRTTHHAGRASDLPGRLRPSGGVAGPSRARAPFRPRNPGRDRGSPSPTTAPRASCGPSWTSRSHFPFALMMGTGYGLEPDWRPRQVPGRPGGPRTAVRPGRSRPTTRGAWSENTARFTSRTVGWATACWSAQSGTPRAVRVHRLGLIAQPRPRGPTQRYDTGRTASTSQ